MPVLLLLFFFTYLDLPSSASLIVLWLYHSRLPDWTYTSNARLVDILWKNSDLSELPSSFRRSFWSFYRVQNLFRSTSLFQIRQQISDAICHAMYDCAWMKCPSIFLDSFFSFFIFPRFNECEMQMSYASAMIGLTNALCKHCVPNMLLTDS